jgi:hypothetical protein
MRLFSMDTSICTHGKQFKNIKQLLTQLPSLNATSVARDPRLDMLEMKLVHIQKHLDSFISIGSQVFQLYEVFTIWVKSDFFLRMPDHRTLYITQQHLTFHRNPTTTP